MDADQAQRKRMTSFAWTTIRTLGARAKGSLFQVRKLRPECLVDATALYIAIQNVQESMGFSIPISSAATFVAGVRQAYGVRRHVRRMRHWQRSYHNEQMMKSMTPYLVVRTNAHKRVAKMRRQNGRVIHPMFHGTSALNALSIMVRGFDVDSAVGLYRGMLGPGVYITPNVKKANVYTGNSSWSATSWTHIDQGDRLIMARDPRVAMSDMLRSALLSEFGLGGLDHGMLARRKAQNSDRLSALTFKALCPDLDTEDFHHSAIRSARILKSLAKQLQYIDNATRGLVIASALHQSQDKLALRGPNATAYGGSLRNSEYCIRSPSRVVPAATLIVAPRPEFIASALHQALVEDSHKRRTPPEPDTAAMTQTTVTFTSTAIAASSTTAAATTTTYATATDNSFASFATPPPPLS